MPDKSLALREGGIKVTIERAIVILRHYLNKDSRCYDPDLFDAVQLGIVALHDKRDREKGKTK